MRILFAGNKERGVVCLRALAAMGYDVIGVVVHPSGQNPAPKDSVAGAAIQLGLTIFQPVNVNETDVVDQLRKLAPDLIVLAGYGQILKEELINLPPLGCINLHAGKLPQYRGSSPVNWALISGEKDFGLSIIQVDSGVDSGDVLLERTFPIGTNDTIADLQETANQAFPKMLLEVVAQIRAGTVKRRKQDESQTRYYPLRFPEDGLVLWDLYTADQVHNRIRALTDPYPGAFTFFKGRRVKLLRSKLARRIYYGEPGRVYLKNTNGLLVCALDRCLWVERAVFEDTHDDAFELVERYEKFATIRDLSVRHLVAQAGR